MRLLSCSFLHDQEFLFVVERDRFRDFAPENVDRGKGQQTSHEGDTNVHRIGEPFAERFHVPVGNVVVVMPPGRYSAGDEDMGDAHEQQEQEEHDEKVTAF